MPKSKKIALMFSVSRAEEAQILRGVSDYAAKRGTWTLDRNPELYTISLRALTGWSGHGVLAPLWTNAQVRAAKRLGVPVVNIAGALRHTGVPRVMVDQEAVGRLAAEHFLQRGFRRLAYFGEEGMWYSQQRQHGFTERIAQAGGRCSVLEAPTFSPSHPWYRWQGLLVRWLKTLKPPVGLMAVHDYRARMVLDACLQIGLRVPDDVALIGVDNDEIACEFGKVPLTSIPCNGWQEGYEAAALLDRLMSGKPPPKHDILIPPEAVVPRRSTDVEAIENPHVATAVQMIHEHLGEPFGIELFDRHLAVSRRYLYYHFMRCLNCTPYQYINRARIERAKQLLADPEKLQLQQIARACGFRSIARLRLVFRRIVGVDPAAYRRSLSVRR